MHRLVFSAVAITAAVAGPATAQPCFYNAYGQIVCMQSPSFQPQPHRSPFLSDTPVLIDPSGGCEGGSCVNFGPDH
jgi:hypothetical protein